MKTIVNGIELAYEIHGTGTPVVLLHAFPLNRTMWEPQVAELSKDFQIITPDFRGFGESKGTDEPYTMDLLGEDIYALLNRLSLSTVVLGGLSMGGYVAFAFYQKYPERVKALVLANTRAEADTEEGKANRKAMAELVQKKGVEVIAEQMTPKLLGKSTLEQNPELVSKIKHTISSTSPLSIANAQLGMAQRPDSNSTLKEITCPTLILVGEEDVLATVAMSDNMKLNIQNSELQVIPQAGHLSNMEQPRAFNIALKKFLHSAAKPQISEL
ncbi:MAG: alpha/beta fold hydrolase [bacterium]